MPQQPAKNQPHQSENSGLSTAAASSTDNTRNKSVDLQNSLEKYLTELTEGGNSQATIRNYRSDIGQFINFWRSENGNSAVASQDNNNWADKKQRDQAVEKFIADQRKKGLAEATIRRKSVSVSQYLTWLHEAQTTEKPEENAAGSTATNSSQSEKSDYLISMEIEKALNDYLTVLTFNSAADATIRNYRSDIKQFAYFAKQKTLQGLLTLENLRKFALGEKQKGLKPTSIQRKLVSITQFATWAQRKKLVSNVSADWPNLVMDSVFSGSGGPIILNVPQEEQAKPIKTKRKREGLLAALVLLLLLFGSSIGLFLVQTVQEIRQQAAVPSDSSTTTTTTSLSQTDYNTLLSMIQGEHVVPFNGRLYRADSGEQIIGQAVAFFSLLDGPSTDAETVWESGACQIATDTQGVFNINLGGGAGQGDDGSDCGAPLTSDVYYGNSNLWLSTTIGGESLALYPIKVPSFSQDAGLLGGAPLGDPVVNHSVLYMNPDGEILFADEPTFNVAQGDLTLAGENFYFVTEGRGGSIFDNFISAPSAILGGTGDIPLTLRRSAAATESALLSWQDSLGNSLGVISTSGNIGVGTTNPQGLIGLGNSGAYLSASGNDLLFYDVNTGTVKTLSELAAGGVDTNFWAQSGSNISYAGGNVSVGTSASEQNLTISGNIQLGTSDGDRYIYFDNGGSNNAGFRYNASTDKMQFSNDGSTWSDFGTGSGAVTSVSNADGTLTISPTTGAVVASLNLGNANTWTALQTFNSIAIADTDVALTGATTNFTATGNVSINTDDLFIQKSNGNVGVGTTSPNAELDVNGTVLGLTFSDGTATLSGGILDLGTNTLYDGNLTGDWSFNSGNLSAIANLTATGDITFSGLSAGTDDTVITLNGSNQLETREIDTRAWGSSLVDGSGTTGYLSRWYDNNTLANSVVYDDGTNVGIGTTTPEELLTLEGNLQFGTSDGTRYIYFDNGSANNAGFRYNATDDQLEFSDDGGTWTAFSDLTSGLVTSVSNADGTLTISPTTGDVVASLNLGNANTWTALQTFDGITATGTVTFSGLSGDTDDTVLILNSSNEVTTREIDTRVWGSTLIDGSGTAGYVPYWFDNNTLAAEQYLATSRGGLGANVSAAGAGELLYSNGTTSYATLASGSSGQLLVSGGAGAPSWSNITSRLSEGNDIDISGSTIATIALEDDIDVSAIRASSINGLYLYDDGGNMGLFVADQGNIGIGTDTPDSKLHVDVGGANRNIKFSADSGFSTGLDLFSGSQYSQVMQEITGELSLKNRNLDENIQFLVNDGGSLETKVIIEGSSGNVGIGETSPEQLLNVADNIQLGTSDGTRYIYFDNGSANNAGFRYNATDDQLEFSDDGGTWTAFNSFGSGSVSSVSNADGTLTISPTTGDVVASLNLGNANTWTALQTFNSIAIADTDVALTGANTNFSATGNVSINSDDLFIQKSDGNVGVGTTSPNAELEVNGTARALSFFDGTATLSGGTLDLGTNTIYDGNLTGNWSFNSGNLSAIADLTATGGITFSGLSAGTDDTVITLNGSNQLETREIDTRVWGSTLLDGSGTTGYLARWTDENTLANSVVYDNGTNVGIGTTVPEELLTIADNIQLGITDGTRYIYFDNGTANNSGFRYNSSSDAMEFSDDGTTWTAFSDLTNAVTSVSNADGTLTISPTTGDVVASLNLGNANTWTALQTFDGITATGTVAFSGLSGDTDNTVLILNGSNEVATREIDSRVWGSSLLDGSGTTGYVAYWADNDTLTSEQYLSTGRGGLGNNVTAAGAGEILYSTSTSVYDSLAAGSGSQILTSGGAGAPSWSNIASLLTEGNDINITGTTNATIALEDDIDVSIIRASGAGGLSLYDNSSNLGLFIESGGNVGVGTSSPNAELDVNGTAQALSFFDGTATLSSGTLDLGTNTIYDGNLTGNWSFNSGNLSAIANLTATGDVTFSGLSAGTDDTVITLNGSNQLETREIDTRVWGSTLVDGSGTTGYLARWSDNNTIANSVIYDDGTNVGIGTTSPEEILTIEGNFQLGTSDGTRYIYFDNGSANNAGIRYNSSADQMEFSNDGSSWTAFSDLTSGLVTSVSNADGTLTISPTTGDVVASLNLGNANTWTALQTFNSIAIADTDVALTGANTNFSATGNVSFNTDDIFIQKSDGNVGVGTTSPNAELEVNGTARALSFFDGTATLSGGTLDLGTNTISDGNFTGDWSFNSGNLSAIANLTSTGTVTLSGLSGGTDDTVITINGSNQLETRDIDTRVWGSTLVDGSGTTGYLARWTDDNTIANSVIYDDGTNVGIGTTSPEELLTLNGNIQLGITDGTRYIYFDNGTANNAGVRYNSSTDEIEYSDDGITWTAFDDLTNAVTSVSNADGTLTISPTTGDVVASLNLGNANTWTALQTFNSIAIADTDVALTGANTNFTATGNVSFGGSDLFIQGSDGNVGIGTTSPGAELDVNGTAQALVFFDGTATLSGGTLDLGTNTIYDGNLTGNWAFNSGNLSAIADITASGTVTFSGLSGGTDDTVVTLNGSNQLETRDIDTRVWGSTLVDGSGTTGYLARWNDNNTIANSVVYDDGTNVGIGTTSPEELVTVDGNIQLGTTDGTRYIYFDNGSANNAGFRYNASSDQMEYSDDGTIWNNFSSGGAVTSVSNADGTLTISPTTGDVVASLNLGNANTWTALQTFNSIAIADTDVALTGANTNFSATGNVSFNTDDIFIQKSDGNVGIGTTSPDAELEVNGTVLGLAFSDGTATLSGGTLDLGTNTIYDGNFTGDWSFNSGNLSAIANLTSTGTVTLSGLSGGTDDTVITINGSNQLETREISSKVWGSSLLDGSGTTGYLARWYDNDTLSTSVLYDDGTNIGIGTTSPDRLFEIFDASNPQLRLSQADGSVYADLQMTSNGDLTLNVDGVSNQLVLDNSGAVGIGTATPSYTLDVTSGTTNEVARFNSSDDLAQIVLSDDDTTGYINVKDSLLQFGLTSGQSTNNVTVDANGNVGIGTLSPGAKLDVAGASSSISNTSGDITFDAASDTISFSGDDITNIGSAFISGSLGVGGVVSPEQSITTSGNIQLGTTDGTRYIYFDNGTANNAGFRYNHSTDKMEYSDDGTTWTAFSDLGGGSFFTNSNSALASGSYLDVTHNQSTTNVIATAWIHNGTNWIEIDDFGRISHNIYDPNLVSWFKAEEASGDLDNAEGTSARDLIDKGAPTYQQTGKINYAIDLDGTDDFFCTGSGTTCADADAYDFGATDFTIGGWFKHDTIATNPDYMMVKYSDSPAIDTGDGADGSITVGSNTNINDTNLISGRSCADGGDAVNYVVTGLTSTTATLNSSPSSGCLSAGDEILLINLQGTSSSTTNLGNFEVLEVDSVSTNTVTFVNAKSNYYGDGANDTNIGTSVGTQRVMLQRVPNYTDVTVNSTINFYPDDYSSSTGLGGVMFFKATGTVTVTGNIHADGKGYTGGTAATATNDGGDAGEGGSYSGGSGGRGGVSDANGTAGVFSGGGGAGGDYNPTNTTGGAGVSTAGASGGGGGGSSARVGTTIYARGGGGAGGGHGTGGSGGEGGAAPGTTGGDSGTGSASGAGGDAYYASSNKYAAGGGGGAANYGATDLSVLTMGGGGGGGGAGQRADTGAVFSGYNGADGAGIVAITADTITVSGTISADGNANANNDNYGGCGGSGAGGAVKLTGDTITMGTSLVTADGGIQDACNNSVGGAGGDGRVAVEYVTSVSGSTSPTYNSTQVANESGGYKLYMNPAGNFVFAIDDDLSSFPADSAATATDSYDDNEWHHVVGVKKGSEYIKLFVDGEEVSGDYSLAATGSTSNGNPFYLGVDYDGSSNPWDGLFDEPFVYSRALTASEVEELYQANSKFRIEIPDNNTVRLYNNSGGTANVKLNVVTDQTASSPLNFWNQSGSDINYTAGNVGIGTSSPNQLLDLLSVSAPQLRLSYDTSNYNSLQVASDGGLTWSALGTDADLNFDFSGATDGDFSINTNDLFVDTSSGNVGINTSNPGYRLDIQDNVTNYVMNIFNDGNSFTRRGLNIAGGQDAGFFNALRFADGGDNNEVEFYLRSGDLAWDLGASGSATEVMRLTQSGNLGIGETSAGVKLHVTDTSIDGDLFRLEDSDGTCNWNPESGSATPSCSSDARLKTNIRDAAPTLEYLNAMNIRDYEVIASGNTLTGVIAQEILEVHPELVSVDKKTGLYMVKEIGSWQLIKAIQELDDKIAALAIGENITIAGQNIRDYIQNIVNETIANLPDDTFGGDAELLSPVPGEDVTIKLDETTDGDASVLQVTNQDDAAVLTIDNEGNINSLGKLTVNDIEASGSTKLGQLSVTGDATVSGTLAANRVDATSSRLEYLEGKIAEFEEVKATTLQVKDATISGTLTAENIAGLEDKVAATFEKPSFLNTLFGNVDQVDPFDGFDLDTANAQDLNLALADLELEVEDVAINASAVFINDYFKVNGSGYVGGSLGIGQNLVVGDGIQIGNGAIAYRPTDPEASDTLHIQPDRVGNLAFLGNLMVLSEDGVVSINGDLRVAGDVDVAGETTTNSLLTNLLKPNDPNSPIQIQLAEEASQSGQLNNSRFEIIDQLGTPVATISASGKADFSGGVGVDTGSIQTTSPGVFVTTKTAGKAYIPTGLSQVVIKSEDITEDTLIYVTPLGSTNNQTIYVKKQTAENPNTLTKEGNFVVSLDFPLTQDVYFNWWIVQ